MALGSRATFSAKTRKSARTALQLGEGLVGGNRHVVEVVVQLGLGEQLLDGAIGVQAAAAVAELAGQELEVGGQDIDSPDGLADVGRGGMVDRAPPGL